MATREELEALVEEDPTDDSAFEILGDLLQLEGDPRGELIGLDAAYLRGGDRRLWAQRRAEVLDQYLELQPRTGSNIHYRWHLGFVRRVSLGTSVNYLAIFGHPSLRFVTELVFLDPSEGGEFRTFFIEACRATPLLRSLAIGDPDEKHHHWTQEREVFQLSGLVELARVEQLFACIAVEIGFAPRLRWLRLEGDPDAVRRLRGAKLPSLETLSIRDDIYGLENLRWLVESPPRSLVDLELVGANGNELIPALVGSRLLAQLRSLRLWNAEISVETARLITRDAFGHLDLLDLSDPLLDDAAIAQVSGVCREVRTISPWMRAILQRPG